MAIIGANAHEARFRDMPVATPMHISYRCNYANNTPRPQEYVICDVQKPV